MNFSSEQPAVVGSYKRKLIYTRARTTLLISLLSYWLCFDRPERSSRENDAMFKNAIAVVSFDT